jgi:hypothetical protein
MRSSKRSSPPRSGSSVKLARFPPVESLASSGTSAPSAINGGIVAVRSCGVWRKRTEPYLRRATFGRYCPATVGARTRDNHQGMQEYQRFRRATDSDEYTSPAPADRNHRRRQSGWVSLFTQGLEREEKKAPTIHSAGRARRGF